MDSLYGNVDGMPCSNTAALSFTSKANKAGRLMLHQLLSVPLLFAARIVRRISIAVLAKLHSCIEGALAVKHCR